jgi:hypothetical protein
VATASSNLTTFSYVLGFNADWQNESNAQTENDTGATLGPSVPSGAYSATDLLRGLELTDPPAADDDVTTIRFNIRHLSTAPSEGDLTIPTNGARLMFGGIGTVFGSGLPSATIGATYETTTFTMTAAELIAITEEATAAASLRVATFGFQIMYAGTQTDASTTLPNVDRMWVDWDYTPATRPNGGWVGPPSVISVGGKIINFGSQSFPRPGKGPL